jgi:hypothetical protein
MADGILSLVLRFLTENNVSPSGDIREIAIGQVLEIPPRSFHIDVPANVGSVLVTIETAMNQQITLHSWVTQWHPIKIRRIVSIQNPRPATVLTPQGTPTPQFTFDLSRIKAFGAW